VPGLALEVGAGPRSRCATRHRCVVAGRPPRREGVEHSQVVAASLHYLRGLASLSGGAAAGLACGADQAHPSALTATNSMRPRYPWTVGAGAPPSGPAAMSRGSRQEAQSALSGIRPMERQSRSSCPCERPVNPPAAEVPGFILENTAMRHSLNMPEVYLKAVASGPTDLPAGLHRLPNRAGRPASCASVSRSPTDLGHPSLLAQAIRPCRGYRRPGQLSAIPPVTEVVGFCGGAMNTWGGPRRRACAPRRGMGSRLAGGGYGK
jgi:hypothetical protein